MLDKYFSAEEVLTSPVGLLRSGIPVHLSPHVLKVIVHGWKSHASLNHGSFPS